MARATLSKTLNIWLGRVTYAGLAAVILSGLGASVYSATAARPDTSTLASEQQLQSSQLASDTLPADLPASTADTSDPASTAVPDTINDAYSTTVTHKNPTGRFYVVGARIVAPDGSIFFPKGANLGTTDALDNAGTAIGHSADAKAWGWNFVRLTFNCTNYASYSYLANPNNTYAGFMAEIAGLVKEYTSKHIVVDIGCFDSTYSSAKDSAYVKLLPQYKKFWTSMAQTYKNNTYVWFNTLNEAMWAQPAATFDRVYINWYNLVRQQGAENIMVDDIENDGNDAGWGPTKTTKSDRIYYKADGPAVSASRCNIVWGMHNYGGISATDYTSYSNYWKRVKTAHLAMIIEETGYQLWDASSGKVTGTKASYTVADNYGIGAIWWSGTAADGYSLKADNQGFYSDGGVNANLSTAGKMVWNYSHTAHNLGMFPGSYAASNCASAQ